MILAEFGDYGSVPVTGAAQAKTPFEIKVSARAFQSAKPIISAREILFLNNIKWSQILFL